MLLYILKGKQNKTLKKQKQLTLIVCHLQQYPGVIPAVKKVNEAVLYRGQHTMLSMSDH